MATRATIKIKGVDFAKVYKHFDGYPEGMVKWLTEFNDRFNEKRGYDPQYKFAQLLRFSSKYGKKYSLDESEYTGYGIVPIDANCGEEYEYILNENSIDILDFYSNTENSERYNKVYYDKPNINYKENGI